MLTPLTNIVATLLLTALATTTPGDRNLAREISTLQGTLPLQLAADAILVSARVKDHQLTFRIVLDGTRFHNPLQAQLDSFAEPITPLTCQGWGNFLISGAITAIGYTWDAGDDSATQIYTARDCKAAP